MLRRAISEIKLKRTDTTLDLSQRQRELGKKGKRSRRSGGGRRIYSRGVGGLCTTADLQLCRCGAQTIRPNFGHRPAVFKHWRCWGTSRSSGKDLSDARRRRRPRRQADDVAKANSAPLPTLFRRSFSSHRQNVHVQGQEVRPRVLHQHQGHPRPLKAQGL